MRRSLRIAGALIQSQASRHGICGGPSGTGAQSSPSTTVLFFQYASVTLVKGKALFVVIRGGPEGYETSRLSHFLDNRLTDGGEVVSLMRQPPFTPQEDSWYSFLLQAESTLGT
jgi:hypothetical protein